MTSLPGCGGSERVVGNLESEPNKQQSAAKMMGKLTGCPSSWRKRDRAHIRDGDNQPSGLVLRKGTSVRRGLDRPPK
jgi:hypothetical protein